jgi:flavin reductase (DIM6/NTAB) family NADH-FMN oxidoreductase RutF
MISPQWIILSFYLSLTRALLQPTSNPPLLDVPTYALATLNKDGSTNMNIMTYATPVSAQPTRVWSLGVYRETLTEENLRRKPVGVLQLLTKDHIDLVPILGGNSGRDLKKKDACAKAGFDWISSDHFGGLQVLPGCASYLFLTIQGGIVDAGSHLIVPYCEVQSMYTSTEAISSDHLRTGKLRDLGVITDKGRVADMQRDVANRGFLLS